MPFRSKLMKTRWFPRPHDMDHKISFNLEGATGHFTSYPLVGYDEALGAPDSYNANPEHASFVEINEPNCFPGSRIDSFKTTLEFALSKGTITTDAIPAVKFGFLPYALAFKEDYTAIDELSSVEIQDVLELQTEDTDRQGFPLYNGTDFTLPYTGSGTLGTNVPGLTGGQIIEDVGFDIGQFYDALQYMTISNKLKSLVGGLKWFTLTANRPNRSFKIFLTSKVRRMNPYAHCGVIICCPKTDTLQQYATAADTTVIMHAICRITSRFLEWHQGFDMERV